MVYTENNCKYECHIQLAEQLCKCLPWDYFDITDTQGYKECDVFGRTCFWIAMNHFSISEDEKCPLCKPECDSIKFEKVVTKVEDLARHGISGGKFYKRDIGKFYIPYLL